MKWQGKINEWYLKHQGHVDKLLEKEGYSFAPSKEDTSHPELWKPGSWRWFFSLNQNPDSKMCAYSNITGHARTASWHGTDDDVWKEKAKRVRCPACGRSMWSSVRTCHDGCCIYHCIPPHKKKEWWKKPKPKKKEKLMRRR